MKKLLTLLFSTSALFIHASDLLVYPGATYPDYSSISTAVDSSNDGDQILVSSAIYVDDLNIYHKNISILPMTSNDNFVIQGDIVFHQTTSSILMKTITLSSAQIIGTVKASGSFISSYEFNMIDCEMFGRIDLNVDDISANLYYSKFYNSILLNHSSEIVGNMMNSSSSIRDTLLIQNGLFNTAGAPESSELKIFANRIEEYLIKCNLIQGSQIVNLNLSNNYILSSNADAPLLYLIGPSTTFLLENNTLKKLLAQYGTGAMIKIYNIVLIKVINNLLLQNGDQGNGPTFFDSYLQSAIWYLNNNFFNYDFNNNSQVTLFIYNILPNSFFESDNIYDHTFASSSSINSTNLNDSSGIPLTNLLTVTENLGLDVIECRDIDDTQNDIGTWGGPHSWANYHTPSIGKGKIIDINLISTFGSSSNSLLNIRSKAVNIK